MFVWILDAAGEVRVHHNLKSPLESLVEIVAPYREALVVAAECTFAWYWTADLYANDSNSFVLGHPRAVNAVHGGEAKNDKIDSHKIAVLLRGGTLPQAYVFVRMRGQLLAQIQNTLRLTLGARPALTDRSSDLHAKGPALRSHALTPGRGSSGDTRFESVELGAPR